MNEEVDVEIIEDELPQWDDGTYDITVPKLNKKEKCPKCKLALGRGNEDSFRLAMNQNITGIMLTCHGCGSKTFLHEELNVPLGL